MATTSRTNQQTQELTRSFHQKKKTLHTLGYKSMTDVCVKLELNMLAGYEHNLESPPYSINDTRDVTAYLIRVTATLQDPKFHMNSN